MLNQSATGPNIGPDPGPEQVSHPSTLSRYDAPNSESMSDSELNYYRKNGDNFVNSSRESNSGFPTSKFLLVLFLLVTLTTICGGGYVVYDKVTSGKVTVKEGENTTENTKASSGADVDLVENCNHIFKSHPENTVVGVRPA